MILWILLAFRYLLVKAETQNRMILLLIKLDLISNNCISDILEYLLDIIILLCAAPKQRKPELVLPRNQLVIKRAVFNEIRLRLGPFRVSNKLVNFINNQNNQSILSLLLELLNLPLGSAEWLLWIAVHNNQYDIGVLIVHLGDRHEPLLSAGIPDI